MSLLRGGCGSNSRQSSPASWRGRRSNSLEPVDVERAAGMASGERGPSDARFTKGHRVNLGDVNDGGRLDIAATSDEGIKAWTNERPGFDIDRYLSASANLATSNTWTDMQLLTFCLTASPFRLQGFPVAVLVLIGAVHVLVGVVSVLVEGVLVLLPSSDSCSPHAHRPY